MLNPCTKCASRETCEKRCEQYEWYLAALEKHT